MSKPQKKMMAIKHRRQGMSIKEIASFLNVSKGSVSVWCQDIILTKVQADRLKKKQIFSGSIGRQKGADMNREKRLSAINEHKKRAIDEVGVLSKRDLYMLGIGLYWGEGVKSRSGMTALVNSDPNIIKLGKLWFEECLSVSPADFSPYIYIPETHRTRQTKIINFWSKETGIKKDKFKIIVLQGMPKKFFENHDDYYGVVSLRIVKSTDLKYRIQGLIEVCKQAGNKG